MYKLCLRPIALPKLPRPCSLSRYIQTACTVHQESFTQALSTAIREASSPHHGFTTSDMPSHALLLISRHFFPESDSSNLATTIHQSIIQALGDDTIEVISAVVDEIPQKVADGTSVNGKRGVSLLLASEDERASIHVFEDKVDRNISLGRAWKSQGHPENQETIDDEWLPTGNWKELLSGGTASPPSGVTNIVPVSDVKSALIVSQGNFASIDWAAQLLPKAYKYGLSAAVTPFLTGFPITLTHNNEILKSGGIAMAFRAHPKKMQVRYPRLSILGDPLPVTKLVLCSSSLAITDQSRAQGNILISLEDQPATYALLERIRSVIQKDLKISKDILLFGQIKHQDTPETSTASLPMIKIIAGDPGKGSIALNGGYRVREGDIIQLFYEDPAHIGSASTVKSGYSDRVDVQFSTIKADSSESYQSESNRSEKSTSDMEVEEGKFSGGSCQGIIMGSPSRTWVHESVDSVINLS